MSILNNTAVLLLGAEAGGGGAYEISRSLRFNSNDSAYLSRTPASAGNRKTWTWAGWVKRVRPTWDTDYLFGAYYGGSLRYEYLAFTSSDKLEWFSGLYDIAGTTTSGHKITSAVFRDVSAWYHVVAVKDTTQATATNRFKLYVNGVQVLLFDTSTDPALNDESFINDSSTPHRVGGLIGSANSSQYLADIHFIDGQALTPSSFTEVSATTGQLIPKAYTGSFGTNGFWLKFSDNSNNTAATLGKDYSGNSNNWTPNNLSVTAGTGNDSLVDTPTNGSQTDTGVGGEVVGNYATWNPLSKGSSVTLANGNLDWSTTGTSSVIAQSSIAMSSGKWYCELTATSTENMFGVQRVAGAVSTSYLGLTSDGWGYYGSNGNKYNNGSNSSYGATYTTNDVIGIAFDADAGTLTFYKNGVSQGQAFSGLTNGPYSFALGNGLSGLSATANFGQRPFAYTAPSGYKALCTTNLPAPVVAQPSTVMDVKLYTGTGANQTISGLGFSPDLVWAKNRTDAASHQLYDIVRGAGNVIYSNSAAAEEAPVGTLTAFTSDGFSLNDTAAINAASKSFVAWTWDAGSSTVTNTQGSITSQVRANASAGFSIVTYTGTGSAATVGHGLGVAPSLIITKRRNSASNWGAYHKSLGATQYLLLNTTDAGQTSIAPWNGTAPTSTVFSVKDATFSNESASYTYVAYCFAPVDGYSSFGSYTGNGSADGPFVYTGFRPKWILVKNTTGTNNWQLFDSARNQYNVVNNYLQPNASSAESTSNVLDIVCNGFKIRDGLSNWNGSTNLIIYAAFAEAPFPYARAR